MARQRRIDPAEVQEAFRAVGEMVGHRLELKKRSYGSGTVHFWCECSCGYASGRGRSLRFALGSGIGHLKRVADRLSPEERPTRETPTSMEIQQIVAGL